MMKHEEMDSEVECDLLTQRKVELRNIRVQLESIFDWFEETQHERSSAVFYQVIEDCTDAIDQLVDEIGDEIRDLE